MNVRIDVWVAERDGISVHRLMMYGWLDGSRDELTARRMTRWMFGWLHSCLMVS